MAQSETLPNPLRIPVADLLRSPGAVRDLDVSARPIDCGGGTDLGTGAAEVPHDAPVRVTGTLERVGEGIVLRGVVHAPWQAACSRCLQPVTGVIEVHVDELFEPHPLAGETYRLDDDALDLLPLVRDALLLDLPAAPLCRPDCAGICPQCGTDRNTGTCDCRDDEPDPRWAALRSLEH
jgi:DUF177 domain-containing protein